MHRIHSRVHSDAARLVDEPRQDGARIVIGAVLGHDDAERLIHTLRNTIAGPDALFDSLQAVVKTGERERVRAWARRLQKCMERN